MKAASVAVPAAPERAGAPPSTVLPLLGLEVLDSAMDAIAIMDAGGRVLFWNAAAIAMFGYPAGEAIGRTVAELIVPSSLRDRHVAGVQRAVAGAGGALLGRRIEVVGLTRDGIELPVELTITETGSPGGTLFVGYLRDISERKRAAAELQASRRRLVGASDDARKRLERNLHDGAQQQLVASAMTLTAAQAELPSDLHAASTLLDRAGQQLSDAIAALRELARGLHPEVLNRRGLAGAIADLARHSGIAVAVTTDVPGRLPTDIEVAAYYLVAEALTNAAKHGARQAQVTATLQTTVPHEASLAAERRLTCVISDDGPGGARVEAGTGLLGLLDRWGAVGGDLTIDSPPGLGTTLTATLVTVETRSAQPGPSKPAGETHKP